ncbi:Protein of unknown function [Tistlia consotensis]|uniref:VWFA domain-containing protein n=1 Tax=Tistlia consotensis USBA 355 TaxID=560819 RepID=A0A1Y6CET7_9PROT|nr:DUF1194 domain-containing protein [Tistlia consotensis]SMF60562.1 Protein of unknown function [Tistlia consotensis USBA 355]SNR93260.1 Protein of unknown function [Tistlia consotensis]
MRPLLPVLAALLAALLLPAGPACADPGGAGPLDLLLVLAVDASGSVDDGEYALQLGGIAAALRAPEVQQAIAEGARGSIAVNLAVWSEANRPKDSSGWQRIDGPASAERVAQLIERFPRRVVRGGTGIGKALQYAAWQIGQSGLAADRKVIDVSGDGSETPFREWSLDIAQGRAFALLRGITINGLAIVQDEPGLADYYRRHLIGGAGAFVEVASGYADFAAAIRRKLIREIEGRPLVGRLPDSCRHRPCGQALATAW